MTRDEKRSLQSVLIRFGLSRSARNKAVAAVNEWLSAKEPSQKAESNATAKELLTALNHTKALLTESNEATP